MKRIAKVVEHEGRLMAEVERTEACQHCRACDLGTSKSVYMELPKGDYKPGDKVELELGDNRLAGASLIAYGIPMVLFLAGIAVGAVFFTSEVAQIILALFGLAIGLGLVMITESRRKASGKYAPKVRSCPFNEEDK